MRSKIEIVDFLQSAFSLGSAPFVSRRNWRLRSNQGSFLLEALVAVLVSGLIGTALVNMYMQTRRVANMTQGELLAQAIAQECVDHLRVMPWQTLSAMSPSTHYASLSNSGTDAIYPRALLQDPTLDYTNQNDQAVVNSNASVFHSVNPDTLATDDSVKVELADGGFGGTACVTVVVTINWRDTSGSIKSYMLRSFITDRGLGS